jgi:hypothetical protein
MEDGSDKEEGKPAPEKKASKKGKKRKGGVMIPDEWPWEEAKKIFVNPDVLPADEVEVNMVSLHLKPADPTAWFLSSNGKTLTLTA